MKEPTSESAHDIDAGWDEIAPEHAAVAASRIDSQAPEVGDLDAGWELEDQDSASRPFARLPKTLTKKRNPVVEQREPVAPLHVALSKKARRELERRNRIHAAQRKAETKAKRKEQRRIELARHDTAAAMPKAASKPAAKGKPKHKKQVSPASSPRNGAPAPLPRTRSPQGKSPAAVPTEFKPGADVRPDGSVMSTRRAIPSWLWALLLVALLLVLAFRWLRG